MISKQVAVILLFALVAQNSSLEIKKLKSKKVYPNPLDLSDDANSALNDLSESILGNILAGHDELDDIRSDLVSHTVNIQFQSEVDVQQENQTFVTNIVDIKTLAETADKDISSCLGDNEDQLYALADTHLAQINECISVTGENSTRVLDDSRYRIDIEINVVGSLQYDLDRCADGDDACISDIIDQIKQYGNDIPIDIEVEIQSASSQIEIIKVEIQNCHDNGLAYYVFEGSEVLDVITDCVNQILS